MCVGVEILSQNRLRRRSCVTKVRTSALYMYLDLLIFINYRHFSILALYGE